MNVAQVASAWMLVIVSLDRFPFKSNRICTPKKALLAVVVLLVIDIALHSHILTSMFGALAPGFTIVACAASIYNPSYFRFYFLEWSIVQVNCLLNYLINASFHTIKTRMVNFNNTFFRAVNLFCDLFIPELFMCL